jgi:hypothetical protein
MDKIDVYATVDGLENQIIDKYVIVRTYSAGVHFGRLVKRDGKEVLLADARRIWYWQGANTLHEIALHGVGPESKISETVAAIVITEAIEIIGCSPEGTKNLQAAKWGR